MLPIEIAVQEPRVSGVFWIWGGQVPAILIVRITWWERPLRGLCDIQRMDVERHVFQKAGVPA